MAMAIVAVHIACNWENATVETKFGLGGMLE